MDFDDILKEWDKSKKKYTKPSQKKKEKRKSLETMHSILDLYPPDDSMSDPDDDRPVPNRVKRRNYRRMKIQETLDLHGFNLASARVELDDFIKRCKRKKIEKVLIIHGKGLHSNNGESVLRTAVKDFLMKSTSIGEIGHPSEREGGCGATWAIVKN